MTHLIEVTPRSGRTFHLAAGSLDEALAIFDRECSAQNRVWVGVHRVVDGRLILVAERDLWQEQQAAKGAAA